MYDMYIMKRFQIYLDDGQHAELARRAEREGLTMSGVIRRAVDTELARPDDEERRSAWRSAVSASAGIAPYLREGRACLEEARAAERTKAAQRGTSPARNHGSEEPQAPNSYPR